MYVYLTGLILPLFLREERISFKHSIFVISWHSSLAKENSKNSAKIVEKGFSSDCMKKTFIDEKDIIYEKTYLHCAERFIS